MYNAPTHTPDEDALTITAHFKDGSERPCTMNRMGRTLDYLESDGERFERVRECERVLYKPTKVLVCSECGAGMPKQLDKYCYLHYCPNCGAKVVSA